MAAQPHKVVLRLGDDVSTDAIYPGRFMATVLPTETPQYCFADLTDFNKKLKDGPSPRAASWWPTATSAPVRRASRRRPASRAGT